MSYTSLFYHIVFSTKDRQPWLKRVDMPRIAQYMGGIARNLKSSLIAADGAAYHVHLAAVIHPSVAMAEFVGKIKSNSTGWIHETFDRMAGFAWQEKYAAFTVSKSLVPKVVHYIENQEEHHRTQTFAEELATLLKLHQVEFDPTRG